MRKLVILFTLLTIALPSAAAASRPPSPDVVCECGGSGYQYCRDPFTGVYYRC